MKNSSWFILIPLMLIALGIFNLLHEFIPSLSLNGYGFYLHSLLMCASYVVNSYILLYYRQPKALIYTYGGLLTLSLLHYLLSIFGQKPQEEGILGLLSSFDNEYSDVIAVMPYFVLSIELIQVIFAYQLKHERLRFWFGLIFLGGLLSMVLSYILETFFMEYVMHNFWVFNAILSILVSSISFAFYLELPTIRRSEEEETENVYTGSTE